MNRRAEANVRADECTPSSRVLYWLWGTMVSVPIQTVGFMQHLILAPAALDIVQ